MRLRTVDRPKRRVKGQVKVRSESRPDLLGQSPAGGIERNGPRGIDGGVGRRALNALVIDVAVHQVARPSGG